MNITLQKESSQSIKQPETFKISAKKAKELQSRISQGDVFENISIIENFQIVKNEITVSEILFPYICWAHSSLKCEKFLGINFLRRLIAK